MLHKSNIGMYRLKNYGNPTLWVESVPVTQCIAQELMKRGTQEATQQTTIKTTPVCAIRGKSVTIKNCSFIKRLHSLSISYTFSDFPSLRLLQATSM